MRSTIMRTASKPSILSIEGVETAELVSIKIDPLQPVPLIIGNKRRTYKIFVFVQALAHWFSRL